MSIGGKIAAGVATVAIGEPLLEECTLQAPTAHTVYSKPYEQTAQTQTHLSNQSTTKTSERKMIIQQKPTEEEAKAL